jgi:hypothetical protein
MLAYLSWAFTKQARTSPEVHNSYAKLMCDTEDISTSDSFLCPPSSRICAIAEGHDVSIWDLLRNSFNQNVFDFGCGQVVKTSPPNPWAATMLM